MEPGRLPDRVRRREGRHHRPLRRRAGLWRGAASSPNDRFTRTCSRTWQPRRSGSLAFTTDRGPGTDFEPLTFAPMRLAILRHVASGEIESLTLFPRRQAHQPRVEPRRGEPLLHLRPRRLQRRLPTGGRHARSLPGDEPRDGRLGHLGPVARALRRQRHRRAGVLGLRGRSGTRCTAWPRRTRTGAACHGPRGSTWRRDRSRRPTP